MKILAHSDPVVLAIDPGTKKSGICVLAGDRVTAASVLENHLALVFVRGSEAVYGVTHIAIERMQGRNGGWRSKDGKPVSAAGTESFETCRWAGRFEQCWLEQEHLSDTVYLLGRSRIKAHLCGKASAKDSDVVAAIKARIAAGHIEVAAGVSITSHAYQAAAAGLVAHSLIRCGIPSEEAA